MNVNAFCGEDCTTQHRHVINDFRLRQADFETQNNIEQESMAPAKLQIEKSIG